MGSTFVYAALAFDELGESLSIGLKLVGELKCSRPLTPRLRIHYARVRRTKMESGFPNPPEIRSNNRRYTSERPVQARKSNLFEA
jgi:hypothetical protein